MTSIMEAAFENARKGDLAFFANLNDHTLKQYIYSRDEDQRTLLHNAVLSGKGEMVEVLLQRGAEGTINAQDEDVEIPTPGSIESGWRV